MTKEQQKIVGWLKDYSSLKSSIKNLNECINDAATTNMGINYERDIISKSYKFNSNVENTVIDNSKIERKIKMMELKVRMIDNALNCLNDNERIVIEESCILGEPFYKICSSIQAGERTAKRIKKEALRKMEIVIFGNQ